MKSFFNFACVVMSSVIWLCAYWQAEEARQVNAHPSASGLEMQLDVPWALRADNWIEVDGRRFKLGLQSGETVNGTWWESPAEKAPDGVRALGVHRKADGAMWLCWAREDEIYKSDNGFGLCIIRPRGEPK